MASPTSVANAELSRIWGSEVDTPMQFSHFMFAFGGVIGPLTTEPFLTPEPGSYADASLASHLNDTAMSTTTPDGTSSSTTPALPLTTDVHYAFIISGSFPLILAMLFLVQLVMARMQRKKENCAAQEKKEIKQPLPHCFFVVVLFIFCSFYFMYCLIEDTFLVFLTIFVVKQLSWSKSDGALISSLAWAAFATGRFFAIFMVRVIKSTMKFTFFCLLCIVISLFAFLMFSLYDVTWGVWLSAAGLGFAMAPVFPSGFVWMEEDFLRVTGKVASSILIASSAGTMANPIILSNLMQEFTPMWFSYLLLLESVITLCIFLFLVALLRLYIQKHYLTKTEVTEHEIEITAPIVKQKDGDITMT